jgi:hypothetical protein
LKKNVIYDVVNLRFDQLQKYNNLSIFQYLNVEKSIRISLSDAFRDVPILNVVGPPISLNDLLPEYVDYFSSESKTVEYNIHTSYNGDSSYFSNASEVISDLNSYISEGNF